MKILGKLFLCLAILFALGVAYACWQSTIINRDAKDYVDAAVPAIITNWDVEELWKRASPELMTAAKKEEITGMFSKFSSHLGDLVKYNGVMDDGNFRINFAFGIGNGETATGFVQAEFANGPAEIQVTLVRHAGEWRIGGFTVQSKALHE